MKNKHLSWLKPMLTVTLLATGCGDSRDEGPVPTELNPSSHAEARLAIMHIRDLYESDPSAALDAAQKLSPKLDALNHLIARIEVAPKHFVDFYELQPDGILVSESGLLGDEPVLNDSELAAHSPLDLFRQLAGGAAPPESLVRAAAHRANSDDSHVPARAAVVPDAKSSEGVVPAYGEQHGDGLSTISQSPTSTTTSSLLNDFCYKSGDFVQCWMNVAGNGWASANSKSSFAKIEAFGTVAGAWFSYELSVNGSWSISPGYWRSFGAYSGSYSTCPPLVACGKFEHYIRNHRWDTFNNAGGGYHATLAFRWNCSYGLCGSP
ncbi:MULTISPECIES: hypothetical protein [Myxococcus]|uniref:hypothetical protein n=1 Tax=Myxococcus TaxID=32 RepID=UPI0011416D8A|nr:MULTISPECIES: hypothetical protein [Myxococcus]NOK04352.1 hypothetical protein [Myxococcus xanthus]